MRGCELVSEWFVVGSLVLFAGRRGGVVNDTQEIDWDESIGFKWCNGVGIDGYGCNLTESIVVLSIARVIGNIRRGVHFDTIFMNGRLRNFILLEIKGRFFFNTVRAVGRTAIYAGIQKGKERARSSGTRVVGNVTVAKHIPQKTN